VHPIAQRQTNVSRAPIRVATTVLGSCALACAVVLWSAPSAANGRFPQASQLVVDPNDKSHIVLRSTFGVLQSTDAGVSWKWICERSVGYTGVFDPAIGITRDLTLVSLPDGLSHSSDRGCSFPRATGVVTGRYVIDVAVDASNLQHVVGIINPDDVSTPGFRAPYAESIDSGHTWTQRSEFPEDFVPFTVDVAPSSPKRIYASGKGAFALFGVIVRSDDGGDTWTDFSFELKAAKAPYIAAIDPGNPDRLYLRADADPGDRMIVSDTGGSSFKDIFSAEGDLLGAALSPDGKRIALGGPKDGIWIASTADFAFAKVSTVGPSCLRWTDAGLYACANNAIDGFAIGISTDDAKTWKPLLRLADLVPLECPKGTPTGDLCPADWPAISTFLGTAQPDAGTDADAARPGDDAAPKDSGVVDSSVADSDSGEAPVTPGATSDCSCSTTVGANAGEGAIGSVGIVLAMLSRRRRRPLR
jgi:hypothetical protein